MFVDSRGYPMFAALFGYGLAQIHRRRTGQGRAWRWVRALLRRRSRWMIVFGAAHAALPFFGDVLAVYGRLGLVFVGALRFRDRTLVILALVWLPLGAVIQALLAADQAMTGQTGMPPIPDGFVDELVFRLTLYAFMLPVMLINTVVPFLVGIPAARHRVLEEPQRHLRLLRVTAFVGIPVGVLGGLPLALGKTGAWSGYSPLDALTAGGLHQVTGYAAGFGYAAPIALVAVRLSDRQGPVADALLHQSRARTRRVPGAAATAAVTVMAAAALTAPVRFTVDRPFVVVLRRRGSVLLPGPGDRPRRPRPRPGPGRVRGPGPRLRSARPG
jgi:uncharacterized membrane protein YeiB